MLGATAAADTELKRIERQSKRGREPEPAAAAAAPNKQIKLDPRLVNPQAEPAAQVTLQQLCQQPQHADYDGATGFANAA